MNDAYGVPGDPPFDLKIYRVMTYNMPEGVTDRSTERLSLQKKLEGAIKAALASFSPQLPPIPSKARSYLAALYDNSSDLYVIDPTTSARSDHYYLFACAPHDDSLSRPLDRAVEVRFRDSVFQAFGNPEPGQANCERQHLREQMIALRVGGSGFRSRRTERSVSFRWPAPTARMDCWSFSRLNSFTTWPVSWPAPLCFTEWPDIAVAAC
jgi:hypothetical protein